MEMGRRLPFYRADFHPPVVVFGQFQCLSMSLVVGWL